MVVHSTAVSSRNEISNSNKNPQFYLVLGPLGSPP